MPPTCLSRNRILHGSFETIAAEAGQREEITLLLLLLLLVLAACGLVLALGRRAGRPRLTAPPRDTLANPMRQVEVVSALRFEPVPLLDPAERRLYDVIAAALGELAPNCRLLARISLDEAVRPLVASGRDWDRAHASIRSKRLDFAIFDTEGRIAAALWCASRAQSMGEGRDRVRRAVLARAGIPSAMLSPAMSVEEICLELDRILPRNGRPSGPAPPRDAPRDAPQDMTPGIARHPPAAA